MTLARTALAGFLSTLGVGCTIAMPFRGPGMDTLEARGDQTVLVSITHATVDNDNREAFDDYTRKLADIMDEQPGLIGFSIRKELFGDEAWTMTAWENEEALTAFSRSAPHREAIAAARSALVRAEFRRVPVEASDLPLSWDRALELLAQPRERANQAPHGSALYPSDP